MYPRDTPTVTEFSDFNEKHLGKTELTLIVHESLKPFVVTSVLLFELFSTPHPPRALSMKGGNLSIEETVIAMLLSKASDVKCFTMQRFTNYLVCHCVKQGRRVKRFFFSLVTF